MKNILYLSYTALLVPLLSSCQIGGMDSGSSSVTAMVLPYEAKIASCESYSYKTKDGEKVDLGPARGDVILVGFAEGVTLEEQQQILKDYPFAAGVDGEVTMDSGVITRVKLVPEATCFEAEKTLKKLGQHPKVLFANPAFNPSEHGGSYEWLGLSNEFIVSLESPDSKALFEQLVRETNTTIVFSLSDDLHLVSADKNSAGNALDLATLFNSKTFVASAEPNFIYYLTPVEVATESQRTLKVQPEKEEN